MKCNTIKLKHLIGNTQVKIPLCKDKNDNCGGSSSPVCMFKNQQVKEIQGKLAWGCFLADSRKCLYSCCKRGFFLDIL